MWWVSTMKFFRFAGDQRNFLVRISCIDHRGAELKRKIRRKHKISRARICKPFKEPRNRFPAWRNRFLDSLNVYKYGLRLSKIPEPPTSLNIVFGKKIFIFTNLKLSNSTLNWDTLVLNPPLFAWNFELESIRENFRLDRQVHRVHLNPLNRFTTTPTGLYISLCFEESVGSQSTYIFRVLTPHPISPSECVLPPHQRVHTRRAVRGWGSIFRKTPAIGLASYSIIPLRVGSNKKNRLCM